jgi:paraquat-inducible protein B
VRFAEDFPDISQRSLAVLEQLHALLADVRAQGVPAQLARTLASAETTLGTLEDKLTALPVAQLSEEARRTAAQMTATLASFDAVLARMQGERGLVASMQRTSDSIGDLAGLSHSAEYEIGATLRDFRTLVETLQTFVETLERDPDMLLKGRAELP